MITELNKKIFKQKFLCNNECLNTYYFHLPIFTLLMSLTQLYLHSAIMMTRSRNHRSILHILLRLHYLCTTANYVHLLITWIPAFFRVFWTNTSLQRPVTPRVMYFTSKWRATTSDICLRWLPETPALVSFSLVLLVSVTKLRLWSFRPYTLHKVLFFIFIFLRFYF